MRPRSADITDPLHPANPQALRPPRHTLQLKAMLAVISLVTITTSLCGYLTARMAGYALDQSLNRDAASLASTAARSVAPRFAAQQLSGLNDFLSEMAIDPRIAFITITDREGQTLARRITNEDGWLRFVNHTDEAAGRTSINVNHTLRLGAEDYTDLLVRKQPIWADPSADHDDATPGQRYHGYVELGLSDPAAQQMMRDLHTATIGVVCLICLLCLPPMLWVVQRWTDPLKRMAGATLRLAAGQTPDPINVNGDDEIAMLTRAFNSMATTLSAARNELEQANEELESRIARRTEALERANRQLQTEMRDKDEFVRTISHDLNAPLRNIAGMTKMLLLKHREELADDALVKLERIAANAKAETELLADLLELNRIKSQPGKLQPVDLNEVLNGLAESLSFDLTERRIELVIQPHLPTVMVNRNRIRQVFQNLLDNAIKYMPLDAPTRRITIGHQTVDDRCVFHVTDTGRGIAPEDQQRIFQVFQRARYSGSTEVEGRGVGLASVKTIVETYGGQTWVESEPGNGATFRFTLGEECFAALAKT